MQIFTDNQKAGVNGRRRSQSSCVVKLGGAAAVFHSRGQKNVALSTAESEYVALSGFHCTREMAADEGTGKVLLNSTGTQPEDLAHPENKY